MSRAQRTAGPAKIVRPRIVHDLPRPRLFELLDESWESPIVWLSAPAGSGKTTLVASYVELRKLRCLWYQCDEGDGDLATFFYYMGLAAARAAPRCRKPLPHLTPEYRAGLGTFTRRYFEDLYARLSVRSAQGRRRAPAIVVLDNLHDVPGDAPFHEMIANGLDSVPESVRIAVMSRGDPPPAFARLHASGKIRLIGLRDVHFTLSESTELARSRLPLLEGDRVRSMHERAEGWPAGMILMLERARSEAEATAASPAAPRDSLRDYFAEEVFDQIAGDVQDFLVKTAVLPCVTVPLAQALTGVRDAGRILASLERHHFFTQRLAGGGQSYRYHPLFRDFLVDTANARFRSGEMARVRAKAARLLEESGEVESAALLYRGTRDAEALARLVKAHARELLEAGRNQTVQEWAAAIPAERVSADPWLLFWLGLSSFPFDMDRTRAHLEKALESFRATGNTTGIYLSWAGIVDTYAFGLDEWKPLDDWLAVFEELRRNHPSFPSTEVDLIASSRMLTALTLRQTERPDRVQAWLDRVLALLGENPSLEIRLGTLFCVILYHLWKGEYEQNAVLLERAEAEISQHNTAPFSRLRMKLMKGIHCWVTGQYDSARAALDEGLQISEQTGVVTFDSLLWCFRAASEMASGDLRAADESLARQLSSLTGGGGRALDRYFLHVNAAWHSILTGNISVAVEKLESISEEVERLGNPYYKALWHIGMAQAAFLQGGAPQAREHAQAAHRISLAMKSEVMEWYSLLIDAYLLLKEGRDEEGLEALRRALAIGRQHGYVHLEFYQPSVMQVLYARALEEGIEPDYVKGLVRTLDLPPPADPGASWPALESWPYPVRIHALGPLEIVVDGKPLQFSRKPPKKCLDLLKTLVVHGGSGVPLHHVADVLWPDAEGDAALNSLKVHLHTLRKLLGRKDAVLAGDGRISLNPRCCFVDAAAFEELAVSAGETSAGGDGAGMEEALGLATKAMAMYRGDFLQGDGGYPEANAVRERLRSRVVRLVQLAGEYYEACGEWQRAIDTWERGIQADEGREEFYRRVMLCHERLGSRAEVVSIYQRCCRVLRAAFGIEPSAATKAVYEKISVLNRNLTDS